MDGSPSGVTEEPNPLLIAVEEVVRHWKALILLPIGAGIAAVGVSFLVPKEYEAVAIFSPAEDVSSALPANLQSIAAQFGVAAGGQGYNVYYFAQVARSREALRVVALDTVQADGQRVPVPALVGAADASPSAQLENTIRSLRDQVIIGTDDQADLVTLRVRTRSPSAAEALATSVLSALNVVTTASIQRSGSSERLFAQAQADTAREQLRMAEDDLRDFYLANRSIASSPSLQAQEARLRRQIQIRQDIYLALVNQAEAAKLREVKNTPSIAVVQLPQASSRKVAPRRSVWGLSAMIGAFMAVAAWIYVLSPLVRNPRLRSPTSQ
jgi:uncharacterized protein involved in exopolysaccharide biosynthesis